MTDTRIATWTKGTYDSWAEFAAKVENGHRIRVVLEPVGPAYGEGNLEVTGNAKVDDRFVTVEGLHIRLGTREHPLDGLSRRLVYAEAWSTEAAPPVEDDPQERAYEELIESLREKTARLSAKLENFAELHAARAAERKRGKESA